MRLVFTTFLAGLYRGMKRGWWHSLSLKDVLSNWNGFHLQSLCRWGSMWKLVQGELVWCMLHSILSENTRSSESCACKYSFNDYGLQLCAHVFSTRIQPVAGRVLLGGLALRDTRFPAAVWKQSPFASIVVVDFCVKSARSFRVSIISTKQHEVTPRTLKHGTSLWQGKGTCVEELDRQHSLIALPPL